MNMGADQRGIMLVELLMAAGIAAMLVGVLGSAIFQLMQVTERGNEQFRALHDVQNAGYWITLDAKRAQTTSLIEGAQPAGSIILSWSDGGQSHSVTYSLSGTGLQRDHNDTITVVARHISSVGFSISQGVVTATVTSSPDGRWGVSKQTTYKVCPRPTG